MLFGGGGYYLSNLLLCLFQFRLAQSFVIYIELISRGTIRHAFRERSSLLLKIRSMVPISLVSQDHVRVATVNARGGRTRVRL